jgi:N-acetylglucosamine-6-phosphate deacetylase
MKMSSPTKLRAAHYRTGETYDFTFRDGKLVEQKAVRGRAELVFGPGFFDLQNNGYAGVDFNHPSLTAERAAEGIRGMWRQGCTHVLPTVITHQPERMELLLRTLHAARKEEGIGGSVPGFHVEGPFISPADGARGAHPLHAVRPVSVALWKGLQKATENSVVLLTLAPEVRGALPFITRLRSEQVLPALGHTMTDAALVQRAAAAGALMSTHLGNGCPQLLHRHANPIQAQLGCDALSASLITDGIHLPAEVVRSMARAKGLARTVVVTDSMAAAGAPPGRYTIADMEMEVGADRVVRQPGSPNFAGSALTMDHAVANFARMAGIPLADAWDAGSLLPWRLLDQAGAGLGRAREKGWIIAKAEAGILNVRATWRGKKLLWLEG